MPPKGRPPKPIEVRNAEGGTPNKGAVSHRPARKPVVLGQRVSNVHRPEMPKGIPPAGQELWRDIIEILINYNAATDLDVPTLTLMCIHWGLAMALWDQIQNEGAYDYGSTGQMRTSPLLKDFNEQSREFRKIAADFGLSTVARTRLAMLDVTTRSLESDLNGRLGVNPRRTHRAMEQAQREIEKD